MSRVALVVVTITASAFVGCGDSTAPPDYVARVGDQYLLREELDESLQGIPQGQDTSQAAAQIVDRWITTALLAQEARRRGLDSRPEVSRKIIESERLVLASEMVNQLYLDSPISPSVEELQRYYDANSDRLRLREPFVKVRFLTGASRDSVLTARRRLLNNRRSARVDSIWFEIVETFADNGALSRTLASTYTPQSRVLSGWTTARRVVEQLRPGQMSSLFQDRGRWQFVMVVDRLPEGTVPEMDMVLNEITNQLILQGRKQTYARHVQSLRNNAISRGALETR